MRLGSLSCIARRLGFSRNFALGKYQKFGSNCRTAVAKQSSGNGFKRGMMVALGVIAGTTSTGSAVFAHHMSSERVNLPSIQDFLGHAERQSPKVSPDGRFLAWIQPDSHGVLNVFMAPLSAGGMLALDAVVQVTFDEYRGVGTYFWSYDNDRILFLQDKDGNEVYSLYSIDVENGSVVSKAQNLTPWEGVRVGAIHTSPHLPSKLLVQLNKRDKRFMDVYSIDLTSGQMQLEVVNPGFYQSFMAEPRTLEVRAAVEPDLNEGGGRLKVRASGHGGEFNKGPWKTVMEWSFEDTFSLHSITEGGKSAIASVSKGRDTEAVVEIDLQSGKERRVISQRDRCDPGGVRTCKQTGEVQSVSFDFLSKEVHCVDEEYKKAWDFLSSSLEGRLGVVSGSVDGTRLIVQQSASHMQPSFHVYDVNNRSITKLFDSRPRLCEMPMARSISCLVRARDGLELPVFVNPAAASTTRAGETSPAILLVHGGPWARDKDEWSPLVQFLCSRGYTVIRTNYRGSTGYGKKFLNLGNGQWGFTMQDDLTDVTKWAVAQGLAAHDKVAIVGGSYGGYATLAGLAFTPDLYACGVDIVGPSNLQTLLRTVPAWWAPMRRVLELRVGNVEDDEFNREHSPVFHADNIVKPLLIGQGANDPRVKQAESEQIVEAMRSRGLPVSYIVYPDEGHGFARQENRIDFFARVEAFLHQHVGGHQGPAVSVAGSTAKES